MTIVADSLETTVIDVGQGDSILVISPEGSTLLIDGGGAFQGFRGREEHLGPDPGEDAVSAYWWSRGIKRLDAVALTHAHQDHVGGLTEKQGFPRCAIAISGAKHLAARRC